MNNIIKKHIENELINNNLDEAEKLIDNYKVNCAYDRDIKFLECNLYMLKGDIFRAEEIAHECVRKFPTSYEAYYYQASVLQLKGEIIKALRAYKISLFLHKYFVKPHDEVYNDINNQISILEKEVEYKAEEYIKNKDEKNMLKLSSYLARESVAWGKDEKTTRNPGKIIVGDRYWVTDDDLRYVGIYRSPVPGFIGKENMSLVRTQAEFLKFVNYGSELVFNGDAKEYMIPIACECDQNILLFKESNQSYRIAQFDAQHFSYYKIKDKTYIYSSKPAYFGYPIPLEHKKDRKKLVLSFFVDGLAQEVINGDDFEKLMPNTYKFFKKGTVCTKAYSCSEWTFPSLATYESGLDTLNHMMFHNKLDGELPKEVPTLSEYFKSKGYYTSKLDGDWRCIYSYGFARGVDQYIYQIQPMGARAEQEIINIIEHLEAFKDTDHYLWMTVGDLHDIADGLDLSTAVQSKLTLEEREYEDRGATSVKQNYSEKKASMYKKTIKYFDMLFGFLYSYIEDNYKDDEIVISLFADHGQGYLVPPEKHFLSKERTKVAFMFRGSDAQKIQTDEIISTADYLPIMCKLAGIPYDETCINGRLPKIFGGKEEREYTITECLHPGDNYSAVANSKDYEIYFDNSEKTDDEGRFKLGDYKVYGFYKDGTVITDDKLLKRFEHIFIQRVAEHIIYE